MPMLDELMSESRANRVVELERLADDEAIKGDFEGSVTGFWRRLDSTGAGIVLYRDKEYVTQIIGYPSIPAGTAVELSHANGIYYSKF